MSDKNNIKISEPSLKRLPLYYHHLKFLNSNDVKYVSSKKIAEKINLKPIQVRKDLSITGLVGKSRLGFNVKEAIAKIEDYMGWKHKTDGILVGCGDLGSALLGYDNFENYGFNIIAGFDNNKNIVGKEIHGKKIFHINKLKDLSNRLKIKVGIICVPPKSAQKIADIMIKSGIKAIWNFAPSALIIPEDIVLHQEDMASSLTLLFKKIKNKF